jgi:hypothetical protein
MAGKKTNNKIATLSGGALNVIPNCYIFVPSGTVNASVVIGADNQVSSGTVPGRTINFNILPDITDSKAASYTPENIMGRASPMMSYGHSEARAIGMVIHFICTKKNDSMIHLNNLRLIQSLVYPRDGTNTAPYIPPPICQIKCGQILGDKPLCVILKSYSIKFPTEVAWDSETYLPVKFDIDTNWEVVYASSQLPGHEMIVSLGG